MPAAEGYSLQLDCDDPEHVHNGDLRGDGESADIFFGANKREVWKRARARGWEGKGTHTRCPDCSARSRA